MYEPLAAVSCIFGNLAPIVTSEVCMKAIFRGVIVRVIITVIIGSGWNFFGEIDRTRLKDAESHFTFTTPFTILEIPSYLFQQFFSHP